MSLRISLPAAIAIAGLPLLAYAGQTIKLNSPEHGDVILAQQAEKGNGPPAHGLWTRTTVSVNPRTGAKTTVTIVASHPVPNPPARPKAN